MKGVSVRTSISVAADAEKAVSELADAIVQPEMAVVVFFCSVRYDLAALGKALRKTFPCTIIGCTSAGEFVSGMGYRKGSIVAASISSSELSVRPVLIDSLASFSQDAADNVAYSLLGDGLQGLEDKNNKFGLLMIDGLSRAEERVVFALQKAFGSVPIVGGSAGDDLELCKTFVYHDGAFHSGAALLALFETTLPFTVLQAQHFVRSETRFQITDADPDSRTVFTINDRRAASVYAEAIGVPENDLTPDLFSLHPLILRVAGQNYVRAVRAALPDGSLLFNSAIETGLILYLGTSHDIVANLERAFYDSLIQVPYPKLLIGCECVHRRLEVEALGLTHKMQRVLDRMEHIGFHTYGEQVDALHVNQTFTGVILGDHF